MMVWCNRWMLNNIQFEGSFWFEKQYKLLSSADQSSDITMNTPHIENEISKSKNVLVVLEEDSQINSETQYLINHFCGKVVHSFSDIQAKPGDKKIYVCGDISTGSSSTDAMGLCDQSTRKKFTRAFKSLNLKAFLIRSTLLPSGKKLYPFLCFPFFNNFRGLATFF